MSDTILRILEFVVGFVITTGTFLSAVRSFVLPRSAQDQFSRIVFVIVRKFFMLLMKRSRTYEDRDRVMAFFSPLALLSLPPAWLFATLIGYTFMFKAFGIATWRDAFRTSGSSLLTLGFAPLDHLTTTALAYTEATLGLMLVALLIAYLPTMYTAFQKRETAVSMLEVRAGSPPSAIEMFRRFQRLKRLEKVSDMWVTWEVWFAEIEESHTSLPALAFFRSPQPDHSWITAAGAVLDAAALANTVLDIPHDPQADLCLRAGYLALRRISDFFNIGYNPHPQPGDPISITRAEFDAACAELATVGIALRPDREQSWRDFAGWRVNYDTVLLALAALVMAPPAPWSSDRAPQLVLPPLRIKHGRRRV